jgi:non-canonical (house-cleaning) NTP pyrophosphatase
MEGGLEWVDHDPHHNTKNNAIVTDAGEQQEQEQDAAVTETGHDDTSPGSSSSSKLYCMAWMAILGRREAVTPVFGLAKTSMFPIPDEVAALVQQGMELGEADDKLFHRVQSKHGNGLVGLLTGGVVDRSEYYEQALVLALSPWMRSDLYPHGN